MDSLKIIGGNALRGSVNISGAKNAALPQIAASILSPYPIVFSNMPDVSDVTNMLSLITKQGGSVTHDNGTVTLDTSSLIDQPTDYEIVRKMRATVLVLGPLLARFGHAKVSLPGGCAIGARPIEIHLAALRAFGAEVDVVGGYIHAKASKGLNGARIVLSSPSVGATEAAMMAATYAHDETEILNAAREPEIVDLAKCLSAMGAQIEGAGTHRILINGQTIWRKAVHHILPDRIEAGTYAIAAAITKGTLELVGAHLEHIAAIAQKLEIVGARIWPSDLGLIISGSDDIRPIDITTEPYPGFPTDLQAQFMALMTQATGSSTVRETIFEGRFMHVPELTRMGASISLQGSMANIRGNSKLVGAQVMATDLRASASLVLAGLAAEGETIINRIYHLDRGFDKLDIKLRSCGANVQRVSR